MESLVANTGKTEYWNNLLKMSERGQGMRDHDTLDVYRLKLLTGTIGGKDEYTTLAQLALQLQFPAEAQAVIEKAQAANLLKDDRSNKLLALAKTQSAADAANMAKNLAAAQAAPKGDLLVKIGEDQWGQGKGKDAVANIKAGIAKGVDDKSNAQIRSGHGADQRRPEGRGSEGAGSGQAGQSQRQVGDGGSSLVALRAPLTGPSRNIETAAPNPGGRFVLGASGTL